MAASEATESRTWKCAPYPDSLKAQSTSYNIVSAVSEILDNSVEATIHKSETACIEIDIDAKARTLSVR
ncbi:hypothetical protein CYMTET_16117, partial [Cymbomonas tetramitiformis]